METKQSFISVETAVGSVDQSSKEMLEGQEGVTAASHRSRSSPTKPGRRGLFSALTEHYPSLELPPSI